MTSSALSSYSKTLEIELPDKEFFALKRALQQAFSSPANMARDSKSYNVNQQQRSSYSVANSTNSTDSTNSRGRVPTPAGPVHPPSRSDRYNESLVSGYSNASSNMTGYRRQLDVPGLPDKSYFTCGASKYDRRPEYTGRAPSNSGRSAGPYAASNDNALGNELVIYNGDRCESSDEADNEDNGELKPQDSISQVSSARSIPRSYSGRPRQMHQSFRAQDPNPPQAISNYRSSSYSGGDNGSAYEGQQVYDKVRRYSVVERRPRGQ